ncbi:phage minor capsid protein [Paenibacillus cellulositrophicus]|uniref:phage minor capsid protein n=1 Tax=Paenibacillus cellulositrophicus TaxID=562959 RepID=UPI003F80636C
MKPYDIAQIFAQLELDLIASMKRNLASHEEEEAKEGFEWEQWQRRKLQALSRYRREIRKQLQKHSRDIDDGTKELIKESFLSGASGVDRLINRLIKKEQLEARLLSGRLTAPVTRVDGTDDSFFAINERRLNALIESVQQDLENGQAAMLRQAEDVYRQTIFKSQVYLNSGASSLGQAIDMATMDFLNKGFNCIQFKDGRRMNIASYAEMALRTSSQRAVFAGEGARRSEWGIHTVVISSHRNCSELCLPWQGKVFVDDVYSGGKPGDGPYPLLSTAMANGLFHPNCRHNKSTYFPGISSLPAPVDDRLALRNYHAEQRQRYIERQIRKYKRREVGSIDLHNQAAAAAKVKQWQQALKNHIDANPALRKDSSREKIQGEMSTAARNDILKKAAQSAKIEEIRKAIQTEQPKHLHMGHQGKHIKGHNNYIEGKSYLTISTEEAQELVNRYAGTGEIRLTQRGEWNNKEIIVTNERFGVYIDQDTGEELVPDGFTIHYGKKGVHIVPYRKQR